MKRQASQAGVSTVADAAEPSTGPGAPPDPQAADRQAVGRPRLRIRPPRLRQRLRRADLGAVPRARRALRELVRCDVPGRPLDAELVDTAELLTTELVTNALVHTGHGAVLKVTVTGRRLRVEVRDFVRSRPPRLPAGEDADDEATGGRGLLLVATLADAWGVRGHALGKSVWFELARTGAGPVRV
ncbi:ATP-binding protein [Streptomyces sp. NPDC002734]|uniref:ATP-binding protein n=1 Tax=Streptomyces sp. NPDC002734 TaxID=3154426 RepID=UPI003316F638